MKASVKDPGFPVVKMDDGTEALAHKLAIFLDGKRIKEVTAFDTDAGWLTHHDDPPVIVDGKIRVYRKTGRVTVRKMS